MSSILKALKKLEDEKARARGGQIDLATDILRPAAARRSHPTRFPLLVLVFILLGGAAGMALVTWLDAISPSSLTEPQAVVPSPPVEPVASSGAVPLQPSPSGATSALNTGPESAGIRSEASGEALPKPPAPEPDEPPPVRDHPRLTLSGIVFQADPDSRMAVVNDLPVMVGTRIEDALVEEIRPQSVVFGYRGERFEVFLPE